jgi:phospholipase C
MPSLTRREALTAVAGLGGTALTAGCGFGPVRCGPDAHAASATPTSNAGLLRDVDAVIVVMLENRSFDFLFGSLASDRDYPDHARIDGLSGEESNPDPDGRPVFVHAMPGNGSGNFNPRHDWRSVAAALSDGRNDGFVRVNAGQHQNEVMGHLRRDQAPFLYALADRFTVCDRWFAAFPGQTWPNRFFLHATTSGGKRENRPFIDSAPATVWERLGDRCLRGKNYGAGKVIWYNVAFPAKSFTGQDAMVPAPIEEFFSDARRGELPELSVIDPDWSLNDGYPMHDLSLAEAFLAAIYRAVAESPQWPRTLLVITFDEHGGYFDHVVPPTIADDRADFRQLGYRVPAIVVGPSVWRGRAVSATLNHASVASTLRTRFGIESLGARMDASADLSACIDPTLAGAKTSLPAPRDLPIIDLDARVVGAAPPPSSQTELEQALYERSVPEAMIDPRSSEERLEGWLRWAQELEAVKVRG